MEEIALHDPDRIDWGHRFWSKVCPEALTGCWLWMASVYQSCGYGQVTLKQRKKMAHRVAWELCFGPVPDGKFVCHMCDVQLCVNPRHLFVGTHSDNMRDMVVKKRHAGQILGPGDIEGIRKSCASGATQTDVAKCHGVAPSTVCEIVNGTSWGWLPSEARR